MFILQSKSSNAARKMSYLMLVASLFFGVAYGIGALLTMHFYVRPGEPVPAGARLFGFPAPPMRKLVLFVMSSAMLVGGLYVLAFELFWAARQFGALFIMGAMLAFLGTYLLWADFIAPAFGIKAGEEQ